MLVRRHRRCRYTRPTPTGAIARSRAADGASGTTGQNPVQPPPPIVALRVMIVSAWLFVESVSKIVKGAVTVLNVLCVAQQFASAVVIPRAAPAGVTT